MEDKTNFSKRLKQFDGLTRLILTPYFTTDLRHWLVIMFQSDTASAHRPFSIASDKYVCACVTVCIL